MKHFLKEKNYDNSPPVKMDVIATEFLQLSFSNFFSCYILKESKHLLLGILSGNQQGKKEGEQQLV